jgi:protein-S-isoprenylcysteine O-methyltransferase Ste14
MNALELKIPPPVVALLCGFGIWQLAARLPALSFDVPGGPWLAGALVLVGLSLDLVSIFGFFRSRTTVNPLNPRGTSALVTGGLYRYTRNPMYLGLLLVLTGYTVWKGNVAGIAMLAVFVAYLTRFQIVPEERALAAKFGTQYEAYRQRVRRWL